MVGNLFNVVEIAEITLEGETGWGLNQSVPGFVHTFGHGGEGGTHHKGGEADCTTSQAESAMAKGEAKAIAVRTAIRMVLFIFFI